MGNSCDESDGLKRAANSSGSPVANEIAVAPAPTFDLSAYRPVPVTGATPRRETTADPLR